MRPSRLALVAALAATTAFAGFRLASAKDDDKPAGGMVPQKPIASPFTDAMLGTWSTESESDMGQGPMKGKGKVTFEKGVGGTAILENYENNGAMGVFSGHAIYKVSDDGKTLSCWWIDSTSPEPMKISGPLTEKGCDISSTLPDGSKFRITMEKTDTGILFKMFMNGQPVMKEAYARAAK
jgi:hypothetical protein